MGMATNTNDSTLFKLRVSVNLISVNTTKNTIQEIFNILSIGMSSDYNIAVFKQQ